MADTPDTKKKAPWWRVDLPDGTSEIFQAWTKGEARALAKKNWDIEDRLPPGTRVVKL